MKQQNTDLRRLQRAGTDFFKRSLHEEKEIVIEYNRHAIQVGKTVNGNLWRMDLREPGSNIVIGKNGSGKTWLIRAIESRLKQTEKASPFVPTDIKNEFYTNCMPLQPKFHHLLIHGEKPTAEKIVVLRPTYFRSIGAQLEKGKRQIWYSPDLTKLSKSSFLSMVGIQSVTGVQESVYERLWTEFSNYIQSSPNTFEFFMFNQWIDKMEDIKEATKTSIKQNLEPLIKSQIYDAKHRISIVDLIKKGYTVSINLEGYKDFAIGKFLPNELVISFAIQELIEARKKKYIPRLFLFIEEAKRFLKYLEKSLVEDQQVTRRFGVDFMFVFQDFDDIPDAMLKQCKYFFVPSNIDIETFKQIYVGLGMNTSIQAAHNQALSQFRRVPKNGKWWTVFDRDARSAEIMLPLAPLTMHAEAEQ